jgi:hypothetical protein
MKSRLERSTIKQAERTAANEQIEECFFSARSHPNTDQVPVSLRSSLS